MLKVPVPPLYTERHPPSKQLAPLQTSIRFIQLKAQHNAIDSKATKGQTKQPNNKSKYKAKVDLRQLQLNQTNNN